MTGVSESRRLRLLSVALGTLVVIAFAVTSKAGARAFPEAGPSQTFASAGTSAAAPQVSLTVAGAVGKAEPISASATALAPLASIGIGYCPGWTCSAAFASEISSAPGGVLKTLWTGLPPDGTYTLVAYAVTADGVGGESTPGTVTVDSTPPDTSIVSAPPRPPPPDPRPRRHRDVPAREQRARRDVPVQDRHHVDLDRLLVARRRVRCRCRV